VVKPRQTNSYHQSVAKLPFFVLPDETDDSTAARGRRLHFGSTSLSTIGLVDEQPCALISTLMELF